MSNDAVRRVVTLALWCALATGCHSMQPVTAPLASSLPSDQGAEVLVTGRQGLSVRLVQARIEHDTLKGREAGSQGLRTIAVADIDTIEISRFDLGRTILITLAITGAVLLTLYALLVSSLSGLQ